MSRNSAYGKRSCRGKVQRQVFRRDAVEKRSQAVHTGGQGFLHLNSMRRIELVADCKGLGCDGVDKRWSLAIPSGGGDQGSRGANAARSCRWRLRAEACGRGLKERPIGEASTPPLGCISLEQREGLGIRPSPAASSAARRRLPSVSCATTDGLRRPTSLLGKGSWMERTDDGVVVGGRGCGDGCGWGRGCGWDRADGGAAVLNGEAVAANGGTPSAADGSVVVFGRGCGGGCGWARGGGRQTRPVANGLVATAWERW